MVLIRPIYKSTYSSSSENMVDSSMFHILSILCKFGGAKNIHVL
jgi:hypothetical protein